jgi:hypothetical protein
MPRSPVAAGEAAVIVVACSAYVRTPRIVPAASCAGADVEDRSSTHATPRGLCCDHAERVGMSWRGSSLTARPASRSLRGARASASRWSRSSGVASTRRTRVSQPCASPCVRLATGTFATKNLH